MNVHKWILIRRKSINSLYKFLLSPIVEKTIAWISSCLDIDLVVWCYINIIIMYKHFSFYLWLYKSSWSNWYWYISIQFTHQSSQDLVWILQPKRWEPWNWKPGRLDNSRGLRVGVPKIFQKVKKYWWQKKEFGP